jgi:hypothetical protein
MLIVLCDESSTNQSHDQYAPLHTLVVVCHPLFEQLMLSVLCDESSPPPLPTAAEVAVNRGEVGSARAFVTFTCVLFCVSL